MKETKYVYFNAYIKNNISDFQVCDDNIKYKTKTPNNMHDKLFRDLLGDKKELAIFLKSYLGIEVEKDELEKYNSSFITKNYENNEADVVYKLKDKKVFILIEHQSKTDNSMPFRLLNYNLEIIKDTNDTDLYKRNDYEYAKIIPIVVYTGGTKWNVSKKFSTQQFRFGNKNYLELKYNLIDINNYDKEQLLRGKTIIEKAMLIEKSRNESDLAKSIEDILGVVDYNDVAQVDKIKRIIKYALAQKLGEKNTVDFIKQIKSNTKTIKEDFNMLLWDRLEAEERQWKKEATEEGMKEGMKEGKKQGIKQGIKQGKKQGMKETIMSTIQRMLQFGENDEKIQKYTGATKKDIEEAKKLLSVKG